MKKHLYAIIIMIGLTVLTSCATNENLDTHRIHCEVHDIDLKNNTIVLKQDFIGINGLSVHKSVSYELNNRNLILGISKDQNVTVFFLNKSTYNPKITTIIPDR